MRHINVIFQALIYISIVFLAYYLSKIDYLSFRQFHISGIWLTASLVLMWTGFFISSVSWSRMLKKHGINIKYRTSVISEGLYIFTKYIPGKIMIVLGRAGFISALKQLSLKETSLISLKAQILSILAGLVLGVFALPGFSSSPGVYLLYFVFSSFLILFINNNWIHNRFLKMITKISGKKFDLPMINLKEALPVLFYYFLMWLFWSGGFYLLLISVGIDAGKQAMFLLSLANTLGVIAIISPGGLGIREGIIIIFLHRMGTGIETATAISVMGRLWYMTGEVFFFIVAIILKKVFSDTSL